MTPEDFEFLEKFKNALMQHIETSIDAHEAVFHPTSGRLLPSTQYTYDAISELFDSPPVPSGCQPEISIVDAYNKGWNDALKEGLAIWGSLHKCGAETFYMAGVLNSLKKGTDK